MGWDFFPIRTRTIARCRVTLCFLTLEEMRLHWKGKAVLLLTLIILSGGLLLGLSACDGIPGFKSASTPISTALTTSSLSPMELFQKSIETQADIRSFRALMDSAITAEGERLTFDADIEMAQDGRVRMLFSMAGFEGNMTFESVVSEPDIYLKMPDSGWLRMSGGAVDGFLDQSLSAPDIDLLGDLFPAGEEAWDLFSVKSLGRERVDNVEAEHLSVDVDFQRLWDQQLNESGQFFGSVFPDDLTAGLMQDLSQQVEMGMEL